MESPKRTRGQTKSEVNSSDEGKPASEVNGGSAPLESIENIQKEVDDGDPLADVESKPDAEEKIESKSRKRKANDSGPSGDESSTSISSSPRKDPAGEDGHESSSSMGLLLKQTLGKGKRARIPNKRYSDILLSPSPSPKAQSKTPVQNGDKTERIEAEPEMTSIEDPILITLKARSNTSSPSLSKRPKLIIDVNNPLYRKPFELGWKRELVYRGTFDNSMKRNGDIYYYTPAGKKVRSMREIAENIDTNELTPDNFTFFKEPLGLNDPEKEMIRDAKPMGRQAGVLKAKILSPKIRSPKVTPAKVPAKPSPKQTPKSTPKVTSPKVGSQNADTSGPKPRTRNVGNIKMKVTTPKGKSEKKAKVETEAMEVESGPTPSKRASTRKGSKVPVVNLGGSSAGADSRSKPCQPCSIRCPGIAGLVPTLQCRLCLCLYHYECVGLSPHILVEAYICKNCQLEPGQAAPPSIVLPPLAPINTLETTPQSKTLQPVVPQTNDTTVQGGTTTTTRPESEGNVSGPPNECLVGSVTSWLPHSSTIQVEARHNNNNNNGLRVATVATPRPQYVEYLGGRKFLIIPKHNVVSVATTVNRGTKSSRPHIATKAEEAVLGFGTQFRPLPGAKGFAGMFGTDDVPETAESPKSKKRANTNRGVNLLPAKSDDASKAADNHLQNFSYLYNSMLHVFQYLKVQDLLRAICACTLWRDIASHPLLWRTVRMKNSQVHSFEGLANSLCKHGTVHLDLRKMLLPNGGGDDIWPEFSSAIAKVSTLRKIELCRCPASVVEQLAMTNPNLEVINAVTIKCESMNLEQLSLLKNLKELRLKSTSTLSLSSDISALKELTGLKTLSLTSIKDLSKMDLSVIASLTDLESLDLGECVDFPKNFGDEILVKLTKLEKLRLEKGPSTCHTFEILEAVKSMPKLEQLELVNFDIKSGFDLALGACSNVKKLLIIPTYISQSATTNHMVLGGVLRLQSTLSHFVWGVTLELLRVTELFVDQCEDLDKKDKKEKKGSGNGDSIPVLKPVPCLGNDNDEIPPAHDPAQVEILPLPNLQKLLLQSLPTTRVKILKIPFHATWRQSITDTVS